MAFAQADPDAQRRRFEVLYTAAYTLAHAMAWHALIHSDIQWYGEGEAIPGFEA
jgi:hypothetical protein